MNMRYFDEQMNHSARCRDQFRDIVTQVSGFHLYRNCILVCYKPQVHDRHTRSFLHNSVVTFDILQWQILVWDTRRAALMQTLDLHTDVIYSLSLNRDGSRMVTTSRDKRLRIIDPLTGKLLQVWS